MSAVTRDAVACDAVARDAVTRGAVTRDAVTRDGVTGRPRRKRPARRLWIPAAGVLLGTGWGSTQITPMLLVYHQQLGLSTPLLQALFGVYAVGLIPGLLVAGRWSDIHGRRPVAISSAAMSL